MDKKMMRRDRDPLMGSGAPTANGPDDGTLFSDDEEIPNMLPYEIRYNRYDEGEQSTQPFGELIHEASNVVNGNGYDGQHLLGNNYIFAQNEQANMELVPVSGNDAVFPVQNNPVNPNQIGEPNNMVPAFEQYATNNVQNNAGNLNQIQQPDNNWALAVLQPGDAAANNEQIDDGGVNHNQIIDMIEMAGLVAAEPVALQMEPRNLPVIGDLGFKAYVTNAIARGGAVCYSQRLNCVYMRLITNFTLKFVWNAVAASDITDEMVIRTTPVFDADGEAHNFVQSCIQHSDPALPGHVLQSALPRGQATYVGDAVSTRASVLFRVDSQTGHALHTFKFTDRKSCPTGIRRRPIALDFTLEIGPLCVGYHRIGAWPCAHPSRDMQTHEEAARRAAEGANAGQNFPDVQNPQAIISANAAQAMQKQVVRNAQVVQNLPVAQDAQALQDPAVVQDAEAEPAVPAVRVARALRPRVPAMRRRRRFEDNIRLLRIPVPNGRVARECIRACRARLIRNSREAAADEAHLYDWCIQYLNLFRHRG